MNEQKYDIIIFGATSFVGQIMTRYMNYVLLRLIAMLVIIFKSI